MGGKITAEKINDMRFHALVGEVRSNVAAGQAAVEDALANMPPVPMVEVAVEAELVAELAEHLKVAGCAQDVADEHYLAAGRLLARLKRMKPKQQTWASYVHEKSGLNKSRANQLIRIAEGRTTAEDVRERDNQKKRSARAKKWPGRPGQNSTATSAASDIPTQEEADASHQQTLYDHACLIVDEEMSGETRQRFFAHLKRKYHVSADQNDSQRGNKGLPA